MATLKQRLDNLNQMIADKLNKLNDLKENKSNKIGSVSIGVTDATREYPTVQAVLDALLTNSNNDQGYTDDEVAAALTTVANNYVNQNQLGQANGVATLDGDGKVLSTQLPSFVDDVLEYANEAAFPATGEGGKIYVALDNNKTFRWSGSTYIEISKSLAIGIIAGTAFEGNRGKALEDALATAQADITNLENEFINYYKPMDGTDFPDYANLLDTTTPGIII
jgi:hypothetical protein